jgi:hypothetical protein
MNCERNRKKKKIRKKIMEGKNTKRGTVETLIGITDAR